MLKCLCGSGLSYEQCCMPLLTECNKAQNAEQLMRSRFVAYAMANANYIVKTYVEEIANTILIDEIKSWALENKWVKLTVHSTDLSAYPALVEFSAFYINQKTLFEMREVSRFVKEYDEWKYQDGDIVLHEALKELNRNDLCPCGSGKKFKRCCSS